MSFTPDGRPVLRPYALTPEGARRFLEDQAVPPYDQDERYLQLERYEAHLLGEQYRHQEIDWFGLVADESETISAKVAIPGGFVRTAPTVGLSTRTMRPSIESGTCATIVQDYTALMFSEQACPQLRVDGDPDTEAMLLAFCEQMRWWQKWAHARNLGGGVGAVVPTWAARDGRMVMEVHNSRQVVPLWRDRRSWLLAAALVWSVTTRSEARTERDSRGELVTQVRPVRYLHRRIITEAEDVTYVPVCMDPPPEAWPWEVDEALSTRHGLGFFPGVWVQNTHDDEEKDGDPDCMGAWKNIDALDRMLSQVNKGDLQACDPTPIIADKMDSPAGGTETVGLGSNRTIELSESGKAEFLEMTGSGLASALAFCDRLERLISQRTGYVFLDPKQVGGAATSSLTVRMMFRSMIQRADAKRMQYGPAIVRGLQIVDAIARKFDGRTIPLPPGEDGRERVGEFRFDLPKRVVDEQGPDGKAVKKLVDHQLGPGGNISIQWGPYFNKSPDEEGKDIQNAVAAKAGGLADHATAIRHVAGPIFGVRDEESMRNRINEEQEREAERALEAGATGAGMRDLISSGALAADGDDQPRRTPSGAAEGGEAPLQ